MNVKEITVSCYNACKYTFRNCDCNIDRSNGLLTIKQYGKKDSKFPLNLIFSIKFLIYQRDVISSLEELKDFVIDEFEYKGKSYPLYHILEKDLFDDVIKFERVYETNDTNYDWY